MVDKRAKRIGTGRVSKTTSRPREIGKERRKRAVVAKLPSSPSMSDISSTPSLAASSWGSSSPSTCSTANGRIYDLDASVLGDISPLGDKLKPLNSTYLEPAKKRLSYPHKVALVVENGRARITPAPSPPHPMVARMNRARLNTNTDDDYNEDEEEVTAQESEDAVNAFQRTMARSRASMRSVSLSSCSSSSASASSCPSTPRTGRSIDFFMNANKYLLTDKKYSMFDSGILTSKFSLVDEDASFVEAADEDYFRPEDFNDYINLHDYDEMTQSTFL
ncbi:hypothetical protein TRVA0_003S02432 [Trichomonascus vanleenenianus]|uniref:uncharacterized protein n=1 Tax=Trichomonascus vanleenenianus TaxID=2268995 RepID=UPI003ECAFF70